MFFLKDLNIISTIMRKTELNSQFRDHDLFFTLTTAEFFVCFVAGIAICKYPKYFFKVFDLYSKVMIHLCSSLSGSSQHVYNFARLNEYRN